MLGAYRSSGTFNTRDLFQNPLRATFNARDLFNEDGVVVVRDLCNFLCAQHFMRSRYITIPNVSYIKKRV